MAFLVAGCFTTPQYKPLKTNLPDRYSMQLPVSRARAEDLQWWRDFNDQTLNLLIADAMKSNISVAVARERVHEARALARSEGAVLRGDSNFRATGASSATDTVSIGVSAELNLGGGPHWAQNAALERLKAAELGENEARRLLLSELSAAFVQLRFFQATLAMRQKDLKSRRMTLRVLNQLLNAGEATRLDTLRAKALVRSAEAELPRVSARIVAQRNRISTLLGKPVGSLPISLAFDGQQPLPDRLGVTGIPADLLRARPDIQIAERQYAAAVSDIGAAQAQRYPRLSLSGLITAPLRGGSTNESLIAGLAIPVFSQPALAASADAAKSRAEQSFLRWKDAVFVAVEEVENQLSSLHALKQSIAGAREVLAINEQSLSLTRELLNEGEDISVLDLIDRERAVSEARQAVASDTRDLALAYVALCIALGVGHETDLVPPSAQ